MTPRQIGIRCLDKHLDDFSYGDNRRRQNHGVRTFYAHCYECDIDFRIHVIQVRSRMGEARREVWLADWWYDGQFNEAEYPIDPISELGKLAGHAGKVEPPPYLTAQIREVL